MSTTRVTRALALLFAVLLAGCGGSDDGSPAAAPEFLTAYALAGVTASINETAGTVAVTVPHGTDVSALVATFTLTGGSLVIGDTTQFSGVTANDFSSPVTCRVIAPDGTTATYTVTVVVAPSPAKAITAFALDGVVGSINETGKTIVVTLPHGTEPSSRVATFTTTGASVAVGATPQVSGVTANDFSVPVTYTVTAADASTVDYTVTVAVAASPAKAITAYALAGVTGSINETDRAIAVTMPFGTGVSALVATFSTTGASVAVGATPQASGVTANDFSAPVVYTVTAADASTVDYTVSVTVAPSPARALTAFSLDGVTGVIDEAGKTVAVTMPWGTDVTALVATFSTTGVGVSVGGVAQISGFTTNDFTSPVTYRVAAANAATADYAVTVTVAPSPAKSLTAFSLSGVTGTVYEDYKAIVVYLPYTADITSQVATFTTTGAGVTVGGVAQVSGFTANDFSAPPLVYTVTAADATTVDYSVYVVVLHPFDIIAPSSVVAGTAFGMEVSARTSTGVFRSYGGTVHFTSTDAMAVLPVDQTYYPGDYGQRYLSGIVLKTAGVQSVTATDTVRAYLTTTVNITVEPAAPTVLAFTSQPTTVAANATIDPAVAVVIRDAYGNRTGATSTVTLALAGGDGVLYGTVTRAAVDGVATFPGLTVDRAGNYTLTASASGLGTASSAGFVVY